MNIIHPASCPSALDKNKSNSNEREGINPSKAAAIALPLCVVGGAFYSQALVIANTVWQGLALGIVLAALVAAVVRLSWCLWNAEQRKAAYDVNKFGFVGFKDHDTFDYEKGNKL